jgi:hypothetical protein
LPTLKKPERASLPVFKANARLLYTNYKSIRLLVIVNRNASFGRANLGAGRAIIAENGAYFVSGVSDSDSVLRAFRHTGVTHDAFIRNNVSQFTSLAWRPISPSSKAAKA